MREAAMVAVLATGCLGSSPAPPSAPEPAWTTFEAGRVVGIETRFRKQDPFDVTPAQRQDLEARCPTIARGQAVSETETFSKVTLDVSDPAAVDRVAAILVDGSLADATHEVRDGSVVLPAGCDDCTLILGLRLADGRHAACIGPGYSVRLEDGTLSSP